jgi:hypothetical protein
MNKPSNENPVDMRTWDEFRESGLFWWVNTLLHTFGWALVADVDKGKVINVYPARVVFRGFNASANTEGYKKVSNYLVNNSADLKVESES